MYMYVLKLTASQTKTFVLLVNQEGQGLICVNNVIPGTNLSVKLDMHFIHSTTRKIQIYFCSCIANSKRKFKLLCAKPSPSLKTSAYLFLWFYFVALLGVGPNGLVCCNFLDYVWCGMGLFFYTGTSSLSLGYPWDSLQNTMDMSTSDHLSRQVLTKYYSLFCVWLFTRLVLYKTIIQRSAGE